MTLIIDLNRLKQSPENYDLFQIAARTAGAVTGTHEIDISELRIAPSTRSRLEEWSLNQQPPAPPPAPEPPSPVAQSGPQPVEPQIDMTELLKEQQAAIQASADRHRAINRLNDYAASGLEDSQANADSIREWLDENVRGFLSEQGVDLAVQWLGPKGKNVLTWKLKTVAAPPAPEPPAGETLEPWQLPLTATEQQMKAGSVKALQDLIKRRRTATNQTYLRRGFSSKFI